MTPPPNIPEHPVAPPAQAMFGMKRAAEVAGVSVSTLRRNKDLLRQHGATIAADGWQVPMSALIASGLMRRTTPPDAPGPTPRAAEPSAGAGDLVDAQERIRELERETLELRYRAEKAEAIAQERADALEAERMALRMLTSGLSAETTPVAPPNPAPAAEEVLTPTGPAAENNAPRLSWWQRMFG